MYSINGIKVDIINTPYPLIDAFRKMVNGLSAYPLKI
jgi:hypothetical protein